MTLDASSFGHNLSSPVTRLARGAPTPRLLTIDAGATLAAPGVTVASLRLPASLVHERAMALAQRNRARGASHTMRIWRAAHQDALKELAREASGVGVGGICEALFWDRDDGVYHVSATFAQPSVH